MYQQHISKLPPSHKRAGKGGEVATGSPAGKEITFKHSLVGGLNVIKPLNTNKSDIINKGKQVSTI